MSLCFDQAYTALRNGRISYEQYLHEVLANFAEARHPRVALLKRTWEFSINDPVGNSIREAVLSTPTVSHQGKLYSVPEHHLVTILKTLQTCKPTSSHSTSQSCTLPSLPSAITSLIQWLNTNQFFDLSSPSPPRSPPLRSYTTSSLPTLRSPSKRPIPLWPSHTPGALHRC